MQKPALEQLSSLIVAITGEIGNNSFDHNLGKWPDEPGVFFGYDIAKGTVVLADRGGRQIFVNNVDLTVISKLEEAFPEPILEGLAPLEATVGTGPWFPSNWSIDL